MEKLTSNLGIGRMRSYPWHPQANGTVERWNRTVANDLACFMSTSDLDWDEHVALACMRYNTSVHTATAMTPFEAMFGIKAFEAWGEVDLEFNDEDPQNLSSKLSTLHKRLLSRSMKARLHGKSYYDQTVRETEFEVGDRVLIWSQQLAKLECRKIWKPWIGPYVVKEKLGRVRFVLESETGKNLVRAHTNRLRKIGARVGETGDPEDGVFPDNIRLFQRISGCEWRGSGTNGNRQRWFRVAIQGRRSPT